ncbi:unnamed protein product [Choristocarpus tenellus]
MGEDLPSQPLNNFWSVVLSREGNIVSDEPRQNCRGTNGGLTAGSGNLWEDELHLSSRAACDFTPLEVLDCSEPRCRYLRVEHIQDGTRHILRELRLVMPESSAVPQIDRLRELMLREARLLSSVPHYCILPLRCAWLEQRTVETNAEQSALFLPKEEYADVALDHCVPWTVSGEDNTWEEQTSDDDLSELSPKKRQVQWGGDGSTDWVGEAEPKHTLKECRAAAGGSGSRPNLMDEGRRDVHLLSYLQLPDFVPLNLWLKEEFGNDSCGVKQVPVGTTEASAQMWWGLVDMFLQIVRGVEHLHINGMVHNNVNPNSVWVSLERECHLGGMSQVTCPGHLRTPIMVTNRVPYHSPEHQHGQGVDSHSDVFSLGILLTEMWCCYLLRRGHWGGTSIHDFLLEVAKARSAEALKAILVVDVEGVKLDVELVGRMLSTYSFERPDCFEILDELGKERIDVH